MRRSGMPAPWSPHPLVIPAGSASVANAYGGGPSFPGRDVLAWSYTSGPVNT
jgi:hypothetical protein